MIGDGWCLFIQFLKHRHGTSTMSRASPSALFSVVAILSAFNGSVALPLLRPDANWNACRPLPRCGGSWLCISHATTVPRSIPGWPHQSPRISLNQRQECLFRQRHINPILMISSSVLQALIVSGGHAAGPSGCGPDRITSAPVNPFIAVAVSVIAIAMDVSHRPVGHRRFSLVSPSVDSAS